MPEPYGSFGWICRHAPLATCNILFRQAWSYGQRLDVLFPQSSDFYSMYNVTDSMTTSDAVARMARDAAGTGLAANCVIPHVQKHGSLGDVVLVVVSAMSLALALGLIWKTWTNKSVLGNYEMTLFLSTFALHSGLQAVTQSSMLQQGSDVLLVLSCVHCALVVTMLWLLLCNILVFLSDDYDGPSVTYLAILAAGSIALFGGTLYIALSTGYRWTPSLLFVGTPDHEDFRSIPLFTLTLVWPAFALIAVYGGMLYVAEVKMHEREPALWLLGSALAVAAGQAVLLIASQPLCDASNRIINGAFVSAFMNMVALLLFYRAWMLMATQSWSQGQFWSEYGYHYY